jgi:hypothetical protein
LLGWDADKTPGCIRTARHLVAAVGDILLSPLRPPRLGSAADRFPAIDNSCLVNGRRFC